MAQNAQRVKFEEISKQIWQKKIKYKISNSYLNKRQQKQHKLDKRWGSESHKEKSWRTYLQMLVIKHILGKLLGAIKYSIFGLKNLVNTLACFWFRD